MYVWNWHDIIDMIVRFLLAVGSLGCVVALLIFVGIMFVDAVKADVTGNYDEFVEKYVGKD